MPNIVETIELLESFRELPLGWNFGSGKPAATVAFERSKAALNFAYTLGLNEMEAFPGNDGEIQLNVYKDDANLELMFEVDGTIGVTFEQGETYICLRQDSSLNEVFNYLQELQYNKCRSSVSLISRNTTALSMAGLKAPRSNHRAMEVAYQSLRRNVEKSIAEQYAPILRNITRTSPERQSSFGRSLTNKSHNRALLSTV